MFQKLPQVKVICKNTLSKLKIKIAQNDIEPFIRHLNFGELNVESKKI